MCLLFTPHPPTIEYAGEDDQQYREGEDDDPDVIFREVVALGVSLALVVGEGEGGWDVHFGWSILEIWFTDRRQNVDQSLCSVFVMIDNDMELINVLSCRYWQRWCDISVHDQNCK